ncbi:GbsR/MarR family transcriptional regulator [Micromonospora endolithica]|uniref:MarR family transcriptional regulator n=1 Tax=Micromonospora endolithica TaxID=230091 RepID=A0A3A9ZSP2_9ACTN|nr:MarR family transcriptional regulator [Micromonospora endolithica]RKN50984.1 MarR family transcriptional regulator [Micromonospora endolithica]TWJ20231.1 MarR family protein [Micromonospora endolithica]
MPELSDQRRYAEDAAVVLSGLGLPPAYGKLLGWLLICDPPGQTSAQLSAALGLSKGSVSTGMRMLESSGLARRVPVPGHRGHAYEVRPDAVIRIAADASKFRVFRELMERGLKVVGGDDAPGTERLRMMRDFYAFIEDEMPRLVERFEAEYGAKGDHDG